MFSAQRYILDRKSPYKIALQIGAFLFWLNKKINSRGIRKGLTTIELKTFISPIKIGLQFKNEKNHTFLSVLYLTV